MVGDASESSAVTGRLAEYSPRFRSFVRARGSS